MSIRSLVEDSVRRAIRKERPDDPEGWARDALVAEVLRLRAASPVPAVADDPERLMRLAFEDAANEADSLIEFVEHTLNEYGDRMPDQWKAHARSVLAERAERESGAGPGSRGTKETGT